MGEGFGDVRGSEEDKSAITRICTMRRCHNVLDLGALNTIYDDAAVAFSAASSE